MTDRFVVVGGGIAGHHAARAIRSAEPACDVLMISDETTQPYDRPALSKQILTGLRQPGDISLGKPGQYADERIDLRLGATVRAIHAAEHRLVLDDGSRVDYRGLVVATGCSAIVPAVPGFNLPGVMALRSLPDAVALRDKLEPGRRVVIVGAGLVGTEVAASARSLGCTVTMIDVQPLPLLSVFGPELGSALGALHSSRGVRLLMDVGVASAYAAENGSVAGVALTDGSRVEADVVVVAIGSEPRLDLLGEAGAAIDQGVLVDGTGRTSLPDVHAAGDITSSSSFPGEQPYRTEHFNHAVEQGRAAGLGAVGATPPSAALPSFWTDQFEHNVMAVGRRNGHDSVVVRGDLDGLDGTVFYLRADRIVAAVSVNRPRDIREATRLIGSDSSVDRPRLIDEDVPLKAVVS